MPEVPVQGKCKCTVNPLTGETSHRLYTGFEPDHDYPFIAKGDQVLVFDDFCEKKRWEEDALNLEVGAFDVEEFVKFFEILEEL